VVLYQLAALLLDLDCSRPEDWIVVGLKFLLDCFDRLGLNPRLRGVVDAAREVAVRSNLQAGMQNAR
jgi:hypothetical protein